ncbi:MAG: bacteriohemerythrin [Limisphaerales bacterium]
MKLESKIMLAVSGAITLATGLSIAIVYQVSSHNRVTELRGKMSSIIEQSELVAANMDELHKREMFDMARVRETSLKQAAGRPLSEAYQGTDLYKTIPIVAAWQSVQGAADKSHFKFYTPSRPDLAARNPKNNNGRDFAAAFDAFQKGETEYFWEDRSHDELILARPVRLTSSCLICHGDPAKSLTADGKDALGVPMENMKLNDIKGAFVLKANVGHDAVVMSTMKTMAAGGGMVLVLVLAGFYFFNRRSIVRPLSAAIEQLESVSEQTESASHEITSSSHSLAEGASEQAASLQQTSASLEEMSSMTKRNSESAQKANELAKQARSAAESGVADMQSMKIAMDAIKASSDDIAKIIKTIDEIAFQTNILALNAAVEAARAGEAGMGFAVVAEEVRNLAQRSAQAAKETASKIEGAISKTAQGVQISSKVAAALNDIVVKARQVDELAAAVASASNEQTQGIEQINMAVGQMDKVTQSNAAAAEESAASAQELSAQANIMKESVRELVRLVGGTNLTGEHSDFSPEPPSPPANGRARAEALPPRAKPTAKRMASPPIPMLGERVQTQNGIIQWDEKQMTTGVESIDSQHQELIRRINELQEACLAGTAKEELMELLGFLGEYATSHFSHEEEVMQNHHCPARGQNKAAHIQFLNDYQKLVETVKQDGPSTTAVLQIKELLGNWLKRHICSVDTKLRACAGKQVLTA